MIPQSFVALVEPPSICARVISQSRDAFTVQTEEKIYFAELAGSFRFQINDPQDLPTVGDYVKLRQNPADIALIETVLPRKNLFARREVYGGHSLQPIAANLDTLFITMAVNRDVNCRRLERYLVAATAFGVQAAIVLTKADLVDDVEPIVRESSIVSGGVPVLCVSAASEIGLATLVPFLGAGRSIAFVGSSGVGKSTLINALMGENVLTVNAARANDDRGRHTTTSRMLVTLADGTAIIDTPGMREFALADAVDGFDIAFADVAMFAHACRFSDCRHRGEPGCAVEESLDGERLKSYRKLEREAAFEARKTDPKKASEEKKKWKAISKFARRRERL